MIKNIDVFEKVPVPKAVFKLAIPTVLSMIVAVLYNMVDAYFVGKTGDSNQFAAVNVATPVFLFLMAAGNIYGIGGSSFVSRTLGEKKYDKVKVISSFCLYAGILTGIVGGALILYFMDPILNSIGIKPETYIFGKEYLSVVALGGPLIVVANAFTNLIRGEGAAKNSMQGMMAGTIANIILDPIFILKSFIGIPCLGMGVKGAAIATLIGNAVTFLIYLFHIISAKSVLSINPRYFHIHGGILTGVLSIGLPASLTNILMSISSIITNNLLGSYSDVVVDRAPLNQYIQTFGVIPQAAMGVALKANMLAIFIMLGIAMGIAPLVGYNFGAKNYKRMKSVMKFATAVNVTIGVVITFIYFLFTKQIVNIFSEDPAVVELGSVMIYSLMASTPILGIMFVLNFTFQSMGKGIQSLVLAISRQGFIFLPMIFILNHFIGLFGIIYAQPIADLVSVILAFAMFLAINKQLKREEINNQ